MMFVLFLMYGVLGICVLRISKIIWENVFHKLGIHTMSEFIREHANDPDGYIRVYESLKTAMYFTGKAGVALGKSLKTGNVLAIAISGIVLIFTLFVEMVALWPITLLLIQYDNVSAVIEQKRNMAKGEQK